MDPSLQFENAKNLQPKLESKKEFWDFHDLNEKESWGIKYELIQCQAHSNVPPYTVGLSDEASCFNRYRDVLPYDHNRVILEGSNIDYINASHVRVPDVGKTYILTQGPMKNTLKHFWLMVWEQNSATIVMLNRLIEKNFEKCYKYWPSSCDSFLEISNFGIKVIMTKEEKMPFCFRRSFLLTNTETGLERTVTQFQYINWPDFGVPQSCAEFTDFLLDVRKYLYFEDSGSPIIHCSAGVGRSGAFVLVHSTLELIEREKSTNCFRIVARVLQLRTQRMRLIQTPEQLKFSYQVIIEAYSRISKKVEEIGVSVNSVTKTFRITKDACTDPEANCEVANKGLHKVRKRTRQEREARTADLVQEIKQKQKDSEGSLKQRSLIKQTFAVCLAIIFAGMSFWYGRKLLKENINS